VLIELEGERVDLPLELAQPAGQPVALLPEGLGQRHHRLDEPMLAVLGGGDVAHRVLRQRVADLTANRMPWWISPRTGTWRAGVSPA
jgi:hypothetical protein